MILMTRFQVADGEACAIQFVIPFRFDGRAYASGSWIVLLPSGPRLAATNEEMQATVWSRYFK